MAFEVETKIYIDDMARLRDALHSNGAILERERTYEYNLRFVSKHHNFLQDHIVLRLRHDDSYRLTYKAPVAATQTGAKTRLELETTVGDLKTMQQILERLGFYPYMMYEKYRTTYRFPDIAATELVIDEMPFGDFIEVEGKRIEEVLQLLGFVNEPRILLSYTQLFDRVKAHHALDFTDLSFANFRGIQLDSRVFQSEQ